MGISMRCAQKCGPANLEVRVDQPQNTKPINPESLREKLESWRPKVEENTGQERKRIFPILAFFFSVLSASGFLSSVACRRDRNASPKVALDHASEGVPEKVREHCSLAGVARLHRHLQAWRYILRAELASDEECHVTNGFFQQSCRNYPCLEYHYYQTAFSGPQKGPAERGHVKKTSKIVEKCQKMPTLFDIFRAGQKTSKIVKKCHNYCRQFSRGTSFPAPCAGLWSLPTKKHIWIFFSENYRFRFRINCFRAMSLKVTISASQITITRRRWPDLFSVAAKMFVGIAFAKVTVISRKHPSRDVILSGQNLSRKHQKLSHHTQTQTSISYLSSCFPSHSGIRFPEQALSCSHRLVWESPVPRRCHGKMLIWTQGEARRGRQSRKTTEIGILYISLKTCPKWIEAAWRHFHRSSINCYCIFTPVLFFQNSKQLQNLMFQTIWSDIHIYLQWISALCSFFV